MIVDPDFLDHWKTRLLVDLLGGDELAPLYVLRIWAHCQARKKASAFAITTAGLRALCRCVSGSAEQLEAALIEAGFIERHGEYISVIDWAERNKKLVSAWTNGAAGGRGNKRAKTETEPNANPTQTETEPTPNLHGSDGEAIRRDKRRVEKKEPKPNASARVALASAGVDEQTADDWIAHRKAKRATASATVIEDRKRECAKAGISLADGLALEVSRGWQGLKAEWIINARDRPHAAQSPQQRAREWADVTTGAKANDQLVIDIEAATAAPRLG